MLALPVLLLSSLLHPNPQPDAGHLAHDLDRLRETARVLYVAAHPDDENTQLLATLANERSYGVAYLSLTRGEGGQNAIGDELGHGLGLIRTYELLTARSIDGARQFIGSNRDFGYSKSAEEALAVWGEDEALRDVVRVVRTYRPDVIVTRFPEEGRTHGHHLASARLARRAFEVAGDPAAFPGQLEDGLDPWQPVRLLYNVPIRWMGGEIEDAWYTFDIGAYDPLLGRSYGELAAESRSSHRSQAFGSAGRRGTEIEPLELLAGAAPTGEDPFDDLPSGWATRPGGKRLAAALDAVARDFDPRAPGDSVAGMVKAHRAAEALEPRDRERARAGIEAWIVSAAGLSLDARVDDPFVVPGETMEVSIEALARADRGWRLDGVTLPGATGAVSPAPLDLHVPWRATVPVAIPEDAAVSTPYWLAEPPTVGRYPTPDAALVGAPIGPPALVATLRLSRGDLSLAVPLPVRAVTVDPLLGERVRPLTVQPSLVVEPASRVVLLPAGGPVEVSLAVEATTAVPQGAVSLGAPAGWTVSPARREVSLDEGQRTQLSFTVSAPAGAAPADLSVVTEVGQRAEGWIRERIDHPHLPPLTAFLPATVRVSPIEWTAPEGVVGYVSGAGDGVAAALQAAGVQVRMLDDDALTTGELSDLAAIVIGPRAFHGRPPLRTHGQRLWDYAEAGGVVVVQYQTNNRSQHLDVPVGPAPITIGRGRVTVEEAPVTWLEGGGVRDGLHALTDEDFAGWVQERGLYFAEAWDPAWTPLLSIADPGEEPQSGALLLARHGDGAVFYAGLSFFRQLPAGVPGAYRLLANLIGWEPRP